MLRHSLCCHGQGQTQQKQLHGLREMNMNGGWKFSWSVLYLFERRTPVITTQGGVNMHGNEGASGIGTTKERLDVARFIREII